MIDEGRWSGKKLWAIYYGTKEIAAFHLRGDAKRYIDWFQRSTGMSLKLVWLGGESA